MQTLWPCPRDVPSKIEISSRVRSYGQKMPLRQTSEGCPASLESQQLSQCQVIARNSLDQAMCRIFRRISDGIMLHRKLDRMSLPALCNHANIDNREPMTLTKFSGRPHDGRYFGQLLFHRTRKELHPNNGDTLLIRNKSISVDFESPRSPLHGSQKIGSAGRRRPLVRADLPSRSHPILGIVGLDNSVHRFEI